MRYEYIVELSSQDGSGLADEHLARWRSDTPLPVPQKDDKIHVGDSLVIVTNRTLMVLEGETIRIHYQVFCRHIRD